MLPSRAAMIRILPVPCLQDNYAYLVLDDSEKKAAIVDASESEPVVLALTEAGAEPVAIWSTHHHGDHVGGNLELARRFPGLRVYGHDSDRGRIPGQTEFLAHDERFRFGRTEVRALHIPGHTLGAVAYVADDAVFTGDTLFLAGCGRLFEGTPEMMFRSLNEVLGALDDATRVFCGHEYTVNNLRFAAEVAEPGNARVVERLARARAQRERGEPTMGATLGEERATNPFLRVNERAVRAALGAAESAPDVDVFAALRRAKDWF